MFHHAQKVVPDSLVLVDFAMIMPLKKHSVLNLPNRQVKGDLTTEVL